MHGDSATRPLFADADPADRSGAECGQRGALGGYRRGEADRLRADNPLQQLAEQQLRALPDAVCNYVETQIAMVEARAGIAVMRPSPRPACRKRPISMHPLVELVVSAHLNWPVNRGRKLSPSALDFIEFLKAYIADSAEPWTTGLERAA